jgi:hypothetical protein
VVPYGAVEYVMEIVTPSRNAPFVVVEIAIGCDPFHSFLARPNPCACRQNPLAWEVDFCDEPKEALEGERRIARVDMGGG